MYNLSRIYYYGIGIERDISKSIELLEKASKQNFILADFILYFIYILSDKPENRSKSQYFKAKIKKFFIDDIIDCWYQFILSNEKNDAKFFFSRLNLFFLHYDLLPSVIQSILDLDNFMKYGLFIMQKKR